MTTDASAATPRLRPLSVGELLDAAIKVCTAHAGTLVRAVLVVVLPVQIVSAIILASTIDDPAVLDPLSPEVGTSAAYFGGQAAIAILGIVSFLLATGACFRAVAEAWLGRRPEWRESLRFALRRAPGLLWISVLYFLAVILGTLLCILPGIYVGVIWSLAFPVLFVEDRRGTKALQRSSGLVSGRWWPTFAVLLLGYLLAAVVQFVFGFAAGFLSVVNDSLAFLIIATTVGTLISSLLTMPFQAAIVALLYFDLRVRKEGLDLQLLAERLGGGEAVGAPLGGAVPAGAASYVPEERYTEAERAQAPYWPPPPGWRPDPAPQAEPPPPEASPQPEPPPQQPTPPPAGGWLPPSADPPR